MVSFVGREQIASPYLPSPAENGAYCRMMSLFHRQHLKFPALPEAKQQASPWCSHAFRWIPSSAWDGKSGDGKKTKPSLSAHVGFDRNPGMMQLCRETTEHPFGIIVALMGPTRGVDRYGSCLSGVSMVA
jgi:hypothetical protein